ncbi:hypothetical protein LB504_006358, partial [Fusarium proliferatum]
IIWKSPFWAYKTVTPPRLLRRETREAAGHSTAQHRAGRNICCTSELSSFKPNLRLNFVLAPSGSQKSMFRIRMWPYEIVSSCHCETRAIWYGWATLEKLVLENVGGKSKYLKSLYLPRWTTDVFGQDKSKLRGEHFLLSIGYQQYKRWTDTYQISSPWSMGLTIHSQYSNVHTLVDMGICHQLQVEIGQGSMQGFGMSSTM